MSAYFKISMILVMGALIGCHKKPALPTAVACQPAQALTVPACDCPKAPPSTCAPFKSKLRPELAALDEWAFNTAKLVLQHPKRAAEFKKEAQAKRKLLDGIKVSYDKFFIEKTPIYQDLDYIKNPRFLFVDQMIGKGSNRLLSFAYSLENWSDEEQAKLAQQQKDILVKCNAEGATFRIGKSYSMKIPGTSIGYDLDISKSKFVLKTKKGPPTMDVLTTTKSITPSKFQDILNSIIETNFVFYQSEYLNGSLVGGPPTVSISLNCGSLTKSVYFHDYGHDDTPIGLFRLKRKIIDILELKKRFEDIGEYTIE